MILADLFGPDIRLIIITEQFYAEPNPLKNKKTSEEIKIKKKKKKTDFFKD